MEDFVAKTFDVILEIGMSNIKGKESELIKVNSL